MDQKLLKNMLLGGFAAAVAAFLFACAAALAVIKQWLPQHFEAVLLPAITALAILTVCIWMDHKHQKQRLALNFGIGCCYFAICLIGKIAFFPGETVYLLSNGVACLVGGLIAALLTGKRRKKEMTHRRRTGK